MAKKTQVKIEETFNALDSGKTTVKVDFLEDIIASQSTKTTIKREVGEFLVEQTLNHLAESRSPVMGEKFPQLKDPKYKAFKMKSGLGSSPNLEFTGAMVGDIKFKNTANGVEIGNFTKKQALKADGHNNLSGESKLPKRRYLPDTSQNYSKTIQDGIEQIVIRNLSDSVRIPRQELGAVQTKTGFNAIIKNMFPELTKREIVLAVSANGELRELLFSLNLLRFL